MQRLALDDGALQPWERRPIPELGGLVLDAAPEGLVAILESGDAVGSDVAALEAITRHAVAVEVESAAARITELEARLRALGQEP